MQGLDSCPPAFLDKKKKILEQLSVPNTEYTDASPKGSVDEGIRDLIDEINQSTGFVTTSSCAGRVSVFLEGRRVAETNGDDEQVAGVGGKGAGGTWLFVSHDPVPDDGDENKDWSSTLGLEDSNAVQYVTGTVKERRLIHFKFEAMVSSRSMLEYTRTIMLRYHVDPPRPHGITRTCPAPPQVCLSGRLPRVWRSQHHPERQGCCYSHGGHSHNGSRL
jgi:tRNA(Phe) wybutosine-synthesizing methylase Tyw3